MSDPYKHVPDRWLLELFNDLPPELRKYATRMAKEVNKHLVAAGENRVSVNRVLRLLRKHDLYRGPFLDPHAKPNPNFRSALLSPASKPIKLIPAHPNPSHK